LHRELFFNLVFLFVCLLLLKYLPTDDVNINDQLIGVDQRSFAANKFGILLLVESRVVSFLVFLTGFLFERIFNALTFFD
jgi:hypothetical protein